MPEPSSDEGGEPPVWRSSPESAGVVPSSASEALQMAITGLGWLASADVASLPSPVQAEALRALERLQSFHAAARARVLGAFSAQRGFEYDGQGSARTWLTWQMRITAGAARAAVAAAHRLEDHPAVAEALAEGAISVSWARQITDWTDTLPVQARHDADIILLAAAARGVDLAGLAELAEEIRRRTCGPDQDRDDGFALRGLRLGTTLGGVGRVSGDLSDRCAAALQTVLESLGKKAGPEDTRTLPERYHDALEDACMRLLASGCLPDRTGQPVQLQLQMNLDQFLNGIGAPGVPDVPPGFGRPPGFDRPPGFGRPPGPGRASDGTGWPGAPARAGTMGMAR